ncbi:hypothetical protein B5M09_002906 [Aphanomyces astaci]|uniref:Arsenical-resistance protein n=2 Tax=Aphanomyces astaci TaxID=112090 RepID=A0A425DET2_APHAT|nr:hypothetical protein B5M09_002906 [Aphanomyces astaci]
MLKTAPVPVPAAAAVPLTPTGDFIETWDDKPAAPMPAVELTKMNLFQRYLSLWVLMAMVAGILLGYYVPSVPTALDKATVHGISIPIAVFLWGMILPMMLQIDFHSVVAVVKAPTPIVVCSIINYAIQPFTMYAISLLFFKVFFDSYLGQEKSDGYVIGAVLLGGAPCTAMVFVWSVLMNGNAAYTLAQVAVNDILLIILYVPTVKLLASASNIDMPWDTLLYSVGLFILVPLVVAVVTRQSLNDRGMQWLQTKVIPLLDTLSMAFLLLMVVLIFISQAATITQNWVDILIIAIPLTVQTVLIWGVTYAAALYFKLPFDVAGPASLIACSNFFEMAVAIAVSVYGTGSPATLATVVGVLIEVPVMLVLVAINNKTQHKFTPGHIQLQ